MSIAKFAVAVILTTMSQLVFAQAVGGRTVWIQGGNGTESHAWNQNVNARPWANTGGVGQVGNNYYNGNSGGQYNGNQGDVQYVTETTYQLRPCNPEESAQYHAQARLGGAVVGGVLGQAITHHSKWTAGGALIGGLVADAGAQCPPKVVPVTRQVEVRRNNGNNNGNGNNWGLQTAGNASSGSGRICNVSLNGKQFPPMAANPGETCEQLSARVAGVVAPNNSGGSTQPAVNQGKPKQTCEIFPDGSFSFNAVNGRKITGEECGKYMSKTLPLPKKSETSYVFD